MEPARWGIPCEAGSPEHEQEPARGVKEEGAAEAQGQGQCACSRRKHRRVTGSEGARVEGLPWVGLLGVPGKGVQGRSSPALG